MKTNKIINYLFLIFLSLSSLGGCSVELVTPKEKCIVTFNTNGGSYIPNQELEKGDRIQEPEDPIKEGHTFINWTYQGEEWNFFGYTVSEDMTLDANYDVNSDIEQDLYSRIDNKIYFGEYPQNEVKDTLLINELNALAGSKPTTYNKYNWTDYNYYVNGSISSYMFYQDIDIDNDGTYDYRGVYFTQYRPYYYAASSSDTYQYDNGYLTNTIYWFSYDPIEWNILKEENGKALLIANLILDSQEYYPSYSSSKFEHNGGNGYANNYELSNIRKFLNDNFYNTAFNELQKEIIETTLVDNSEESTEYNLNKYACNDTNDKMFLLSYQEVTTYYSYSSDRTTHGSNYAKSQGLYVCSSNGNSYWWMRSPDYNFTYYANIVNYDGHIYYYGGIYGTYYGVRPACQIIL